MVASHCHVVVVVARYDVGCAAIGWVVVAFF
jgi:hypothetical protein